MFNTGSVIGAFVNVFDGGFPPKFIPSFSWGNKDGFETYKFDKAIEVAKIVMNRRGVDLDEKLLKFIAHYLSSCHIIHFGTPIELYYLVYVNTLLMYIFQKNNF